MKKRVIFFLLLPIIAIGWVATTYFMETGMFTPVHISYYHFNKKGTFEEGDKFPRFAVNVNGKRTYLNKNETGQIYDQDMYSSPYNGNLILLDHDLEDIQTIELQIWSKDEMVVQKKIKGDRFKKDPNRSNTYEYKALSFDLIPNQLDEIIVKIHITGTKNGQPISSWLEDVYTIFHDERVKNRLTANELISA